MANSLLLPNSFWIETALLAASALLLWLVVIVTKRSPHRPNFHFRPAPDASGSQTSELPDSSVGKS